MRFRTAACALTTAVLLVLSTGSASATTVPDNLQRLARQQTKLFLKFYEGQNASPPRCGQGQDSDGVNGVFLLPVASYGSGDHTFECKTTARSVLVDLGGFAITEDAGFPDSSYPLDGQLVPFTPENLEPICDDLIATDSLYDPAPATLDDTSPITGPVLNSGVFTARIKPRAQIPEGADLYGDSVSLGHPGRLATVFCGYKSKVHLRPGTHTIVVDYTALFNGVSTVFTYHIKVKR